METRNQTQKVIITVKSSKKSEETNTKLYCKCKKLYDENIFMIQCEKCKDWFHDSCVDIEEEEAENIDEYHCPNCESEHGASIYKKERKKRRE